MWETKWVELQKLFNKALKSKKMLMKCLNNIKT